MPLDVLIILVVVGIAGIALALHLLGLSRIKPLTEATARKDWARAFPGSDPTYVHLAQSGRAALVRDGTGLGVLWQFGADTIARRLPCLKIEDHAKGLRLRFADFTTPVVLLALTPDERVLWREEMDRT